MPKFPVTIGNASVEVQEFADGEQRIIAIDERTYRVRPAEDDGLFYYMLKVGNAKRSLRGPIGQIREAIVGIHLIYRSYDRRVRRVKEEAQKIRDKALHDIAEMLQSPPQQ